MKKSLLLMLLFFHSVLPAGNFLSADLDNDGRMERVAWKPFARDQSGIYYRLEVRDNDGSLLWRGPQVKNVTSPFCVAELDFGVALPQVLEDLDGDERYDLLIPEVQSDVSPTLFHRLRWEGGRFVPMRSAYLVFFRGTHNDRVQWMPRPPRPYGFWVASLSPAPRGTARARILGFTARDHTTPKEGVGIIRWAPGGGAVIDWDKPLEVEDLGVGTSSGSGGILPPSYGGYPASGYGNGAYGGGLPPVSAVHYRARLSRRDHYNSYRTPLRTVAAILRQDRANFYRLGGDPGDEADGFFTTSSAREQFERVRIIPIGISRQGLREEILNGTPLVDVRYEQGALYIRLIPEGYPMQNPPQPYPQPAPVYSPVNDRYVARISWRDHYNSRGVKLGTARDILRQDRANYYRYGGDLGDRPDRTFPTSAARARISSMRLIPVGTSWKNMRKRILNDTPLLEVRVEGDALYLRLLD